MLCDYPTEMLKALVELGFVADTVRCLKDLRMRHDDRLELLDRERPDLLLILSPRSMLQGPQASRHCQKLADLVLRQSRSGRHFAFYGNPMWPV